MHAIGIRELKNRLGEFVKKAAAGERILVTDSGVVVAELIAPHGGQVTASDAVLAEAVRAGWLRPPLRRPAEPPSRRPVAPLDQLLDEVAADRADR